MMRFLLFNIFFATSLATAAVENIGPLELRPQAAAGSEGILFSDLVNARSDQALPRLILAPAPPIGRPLVLSRAQISEWLARKAPDFL
jgi:hypothetical protein